jgi:ubiquinone/menaquinone biosynthesis C-methylase UbiE
MTTTEQDPRRAMAHAMWAGVAPSWEHYADDADARGAVVAARMVDAVGLSPGARVLELACGPGGVGILAARRVGAGGHVVVSDVVPAMVDTATERARALGLTNVSGAVRDLEAIDEPDGTFDAVLCREGLMFALDHERAVAEIGRVLRPGGRVAAAVWGPREQNPWLGCVFDAVSAQFERPMPPPGIPGPFALSEPGRLEGLMAGELEAVEVEEVAVPLIAASFDEWWNRVSALAGPLSSILGGMSGEAQTALRSRLEDAVLPYRTADRGLSFPGVSLLASGRRAG